MNFLSHLQLEHRLLIVDADEDVSDDELVLVGRELELRPESRIANSATDRRGSFGIDELGQLGSGAVVPDEVGTLHVGVQDLQNLRKDFENVNLPLLPVETEYPGLISRESQANVFLL